MSICVLVADSSKARIMLAQAGRGPLIDDRDFIHSESRLREQDLVADGSGDDSDPGGYGKHSMGYETAKHKRQTEIFARELSGEIDKLRQRSGLHKIYLVAAPKFLGLLRKSLSNQCTELLAGEINKDLVNHGLEDIRGHLPKYL